MEKFTMILKDKKTTQKELSKKVGLSVQTLSMFANGKVDIGYKKARKIAKFLDVPMEELIEEENECKML